MINDVIMITIDMMSPCLFSEFAGRIMNEGGPTPRNGNKTDKAHPPIHPTKYTNNLQVSGVQT